MKITIFSPYSFVKQWRLTDLYLAECLKNKENNIIFLECEGYQKFCVAMLCANLHWKSDEEKKLDICNDCRSFTKFTKNHTDAIHLSLDSFLKAEDEQKISSLLDKDVIDIKYQKNNIRIGKACLYSLMIEHQLTTSKEVKEKLNNEFRQEVKTGLRTVFAAERFFVKHKPDILILRNGLYATVS